MQSPENVESNKSRHSSSNSKLHTPCRQIGLRRKKSRTSDTPIKDYKSPEVRTLDTPIKDGKSPAVRASQTAIKDYKSPEVRTLDTPIKDNKSPAVRTSQTAIKDYKSPEVKIYTTVKENDHTPTTPTFVNVSDQAASVDKNQIKENCRLQKAVEKTPVVCSNSGNSQDVQKEVDTVKKRIKEKEEKIAALRLAKLYRKKHDTSTLSELTERWREGCQSALQDLLSSSTEHGYQVNMTQLISQLGIPFQLIRYNPDLEDFE